MRSTQDGCPRLANISTGLKQTFAPIVAVEYALTVSNGTTGLHLAVAALGIGRRRGDRPGFDLCRHRQRGGLYRRQAGARRHRPRDACLDPASVRSLITPRTKAIMPVHLYGHPADMDPLNAMADEHGSRSSRMRRRRMARLQGPPRGGLGHCGVFSFYGNKIITTGEGGILTTNDPDHYQRARHLRDHAMTPTAYWHAEIGFNYRMTNLQAALGVAQSSGSTNFWSAEPRSWPGISAEIPTTDQPYV